MLATNRNELQIEISKKRFTTINGHLADNSKF